VNNENITAVILAGGRGQRMRGQNKGLLPLRGQSLVSHVLTRLRPQIGEIIISANDGLDEYEQLGCDVVTDKITGYAGPLTGMYSAMTEINTEWLITTPCDIPMLPADYVNRMVSSIDTGKAYVAHNGDRQQSGCCLLHRSLQPELLNELNAGNYAVYEFLQKHDAIEVDFSDVKDNFANINTPEQLSELENK